jgi:hypothetical protein
MSHPEQRSRTPSEGASVARRLTTVVNLASVVKVQACAVVGALAAAAVVATGAI